MYGNKVHKALEKLMAARGVDMATVSRAIGKNHAYIQQYLTRGIPRELPFRTAEALAQYFNTDLSTFGFGPSTPAMAPSNDRMKRADVAQNQHPLVAIRTLLGLSAQQFAQALNEKPADIASIERGETALSERLLFKICCTFNMDPADLAAYAPAISSDERVMVLRLRRLTPAQKKSLEAFLDACENGDTRAKVI